MSSSVAFSYDNLEGLKTTDEGDAQVKMLERKEGKGFYKTVHSKRD